jgi:hypothetical protein
MKRREESGFALLLVFVIAASIAIGLYIEMPRVAFESQRAREQLSIDRGRQYERAVQLFYRKYRAYPQSLDDLETTRNIRFLRQRYQDPLTGKAYRLLHVGPAGQLTDSLIQPANPLQAGKTSNSSSAVAQASTAQPSAATVGPDGQPLPADPLNMAAKRPSDRILPNGAEQPVALEESNAQPPPAPYAPITPPEAGQPAQQPYPGQQTFPGQPGQVFPVVGGQPQFPGQTIQPGQPQDPSQGNQFPPQPQFPGQQFPGQQFPGQQFPGQQLPGQPLDPSQVVQQFTVQPQQFPGQPQQYPGQPQFPVQPGQPVPYPIVQPAMPPPGEQPNPVQYNPFPQNQNPNPSQAYNPFQQNPGQLPGQPVQGGVGNGLGQQGGAVPNQAVNLIQQILTTPRQPPPSVAGLSGGNVGGIVGVASNAEGKGIHVINDHSKYKEWEFIYDIKNDKQALGGAVLPQQQLPATPGLASPTTSFTPSPAPPAAK